MFGESDSESPRLPSPWEALSSPSPSPASHSSISDSNIESELRKRLDYDRPRLVPEVEEGNVEYKLKLINPTRERFSKLVTQLKWRLLEGGGQALYEIGVSDSGQLIGLTREDLEESLDTLERMAGELGATVIVQKEIIIPNVIFTGDERVDGAVRAKKATPVDGDLTTTDAETSDDGDIDEAVYETPIDSGVDLNVASATAHLRSSPRPIIRDFPYGQSPRIRARSSTRKSKSPLIHPIQPDADSTFALDLDISHLTLDSSTATVIAPETAPLTSPNPKIKKPQLPRFDPVAHAVQRRIKRDLRREERRKALGLEDTGKPALAVPLAEADIAILSNTALVGEDTVTTEPHLIAECLVVRKLALEEAFLDFGGFSLHNN